MGAHAAAHGVAGYLRHALHALGPPAPDALAVVEPAFLAAVASHLRAVAGLRLVGDVLGREVPWVVVKGPVLSALAHDRPDLRGYGDLDVLVPAEAFASALQALESAGAVVLVDDWAHLRAVLHGEVTLRLPTGGLLDLHWHLLLDPETRQAFPLSMTAMLARRRVVEIGPQETAPALDAADTLLAAALHCCLSGADRLVWLKDLDGLVHAGVPWAETLERARSAGAELALVSMVERARRVLGTPPARALAAARATHRHWLRLVTLADRWSLPRPLSGRGSVARLVTRATREDSRASARLLTARAVLWARHQAPRRAGAPTAGHSDARERSRYLAAVAAHR